MHETVKCIHNLTLNQISPTSRAVHFPSWLPTSLHAPAFFRSESHSFNRIDEWMLPKMTFSLHMFCCPLMQNINYFLDQYPYRCTLSQFSKIFNDVTMVIDTDFKGESPPFVGRSCRRKLRLDESSLSFAIYHLRPCWLSLQVYWTPAALKQSKFIFHWKALFLFNMNVYVFL